MIKFKGKKASDMYLVVEEVDNLIKKAPTRYEEIQIDGRDGSFFNELGYSIVETSLSMVLRRPEHLDEVLAWLNGVGELEFNGRVTKARIYSEVAPVRSAGVRLIDVSIIRNPFWHKKEDDFSSAWGANLIKSWDDFKPIGRPKPNLIENGWDSFEPYGSGEIVFESDFKNTWQTQNIDGAMGSLSGNIVNKINNEGRINVYRGVEFLDDGFVTLRIKSNTNSKIRVMFGNAPENETSIQILNDDNKYNTYTFETTGTGNNNLLISFYGEGVYELDSIKLSKNDNRHLVVEKTPLGNGLTRIQTWGGRSTIKLFIQKTPFMGEHTYSAYVDNYGSKVLFITATFNSISWDKSEQGFKEISINNTDSNWWWRVVVNDKNDNLDFIASNPEIVEGSHPNIKVHTEDLDSGLRHIRTFGGDRDWKYNASIGQFKKGQVFKHDVYIENLGDDMLIRGQGDGESSELVPKGFKGDVSVKSVSNGLTWQSFTYATVNIDDQIDVISSLPKMYLVEDEPTWEIDDKARIVNDGNVDAKPIIKLTKKRDSVCEYEVNGTYFKFHFNQDDYVLIDCEAMEATYEGQLRNRHLTIGFEFPKLKPNDNVVKQISGDAIIEFKRKDAWL